MEENVEFKQPKLVYYDIDWKKVKTIKDIKTILQILASKVVIDQNNEEDVQVYEVEEQDGTHVGILFMDFHPRASKRGGAWMTEYRSQHREAGKNIHPIISIVMNFSKPTA